MDVSVASAMPMNVLFFDEVEFCTNRFISLFPLRHLLLDHLSHL